MCFSIYSADHIHILWVARSYSMRYIRAVKLEFYVAIQCVLLFFSLSVCGCCAWIRVGAFAHQRSLCRLNYKNRWCDILFVYWLPCHTLSPHVSLFTQIVTSLTLFLVLLVSLLCNLSSFSHYSQVLLFASQSIDIWYHHEEKTILCQRDFCISPALCADILISRRNYYYFLFIVVESLPIDRYSSKCDCS